MHKTFGMISLGCDKNRVDGERLLGEIARHGCPVTDDLSRAEVLIVNTCAFLNAAREESIDAILEGNGFRSAGKLEKIVVTGCLPEKFIGELFPALTEGDVFLGVNDASELFPALERSYREGRVNAVGTGTGERGDRLVSTPSHIKYLKIADGCFHRCTYCLIPRIRGKYLSYPMEELVEEARSLGETEELVLVAQDTTRYGEDVGENTFVPLLRRLSEIGGIHSIRLLYCYPEGITDALLDEMASNPKVIPYLDLPLQHSEDRILRLMGRRGSRGEYLALLEKIRARVPGIALRSTFIAGFPGETEEEHRALLSFLGEARFDHCGFFAYSREPDTPAYRMAGQVHPSTKLRRVRELYRAQEKISREKLQARVGQILDVICDGFEEEKGLFKGRAPFQAYDVDGAVFFSARSGGAGEKFRVKIGSADSYDLYGIAEE